MSEERPYQVIIGGVSLVKDNVLAASCGAAGVYGNMGYKHVQMIWEFVDKNTTIRKAMDDCSKIVQAELIRLGHQTGLAQKEMTMEDYNAIKAVIAELVKGR